MNVASYLRYLRRESRGSRGRLIFFVLCLAIGVAAIVSVAGMSRGLRQGIRVESRKLLAADLAVSGRRPIPAKLHALLVSRAGTRTTGVK